MPFGGDDWLALTAEPTLEPEIPICDPHHHLWDYRSQRVPYQRYLLHELAADINSGHNVRSTVFVEARSMYRTEGPEELRSVGEVEFVQGQAAASASGLYGPGRAAAAIVGNADLKLGDRVEPVLDALQAASPNRFRGIRHSVVSDPHPEIEDRETPGVMATSNFLAGARVLARKGMSLEGWMYFPQLPELADFARAVPELTIILDHIGGLMRTGPYANGGDGLVATWRSGSAAEDFVVSRIPYLKLYDGSRPRVELLNGNGGIQSTRSIAEALIRAGFRIVRTDNATNFDFEHTLVVAQGRGAKQVAEVAADVIVVDEVLTELDTPSGVIDISIIEGKDTNSGEV